MGSVLLAFGVPRDAICSARRFATRSKRPWYLSSSLTASTQSSKPISPSSLSCAAYFLEAVAASGGLIPIAFNISKMLTSSSPLRFSSSGSCCAALVGVTCPSIRRSRFSWARSSAADHALPSNGAGAADAPPGAAAGTFQYSTRPLGARFTSICSSSTTWADSVAVSSASRCRKTASCRANPRSESVRAASSAPSSLQWPGHFCTMQKAPALTRVCCSDSTQSRTC
mmetsp:Transcript_46623/g.82162  ORF Transcript_46623/g.82162 Transcript_46623/m.82162 type:complete len:227 (-) Transcript_46623:645-1325(-)